MAEKSKLPEFQFPGQVIIDPYGVVFKYEDDADCFVELGNVEDIPDSSFDDTGLMTAVHKRILDNIPEKAGGFAIITKPIMKAPSDENPDGLIYGDIKLISDSLDITCIDINGNEISNQCYNCIDGTTPPGINFQLSQKFLDSFCARLPIIPGPRGDKGEKGDRGEPGTGDGPVGEPGEPGISYDESGTFTGVKVMNVDGVYDTAVINIELDAEDGVLTLTKGKIASGDEDTPADQVYCTPIVRDLSFPPIDMECGECDNMWDYTITKGDDELPPNVYLYRYPDQFIPGGETEITVLQLSELIDNIIENDLKPIYQKAIDKYEEEIKAFILEKDEEARQKLCGLSKQLSECEWDLPLEYCLGISPMDCFSAQGKTAAAMEALNQTTGDGLSNINESVKEGNAELERIADAVEGIEENTEEDNGGGTPTPSSSTSSNSGGTSSSSGGGESSESSTSSSAATGEGLFGPV